MLFLARSLARLVGILLVVALALAGLAAAVFSIQGGHGTLSLPGLAADLHLPALRQDVGAFIRRLEAPGPVAVVAALAGAGAVLLGLVLLAGALAPRRERLVVLAHDEQGAIAARRRPLGQAAAALAQEPGGVLDARARARPWRRGTGGRIRVLVRTDDADGSRDGLVQGVAGALAPLTDSLPLKAQVRAKHAQSREDDLMGRQRLRTRSLPLASLLLGLITTLAALALIWYGAMTALLALKVSPHTVNGISAYRTIYDHLVSVTAHDITGRVRVIVAISGVVCFFVFAGLAWRSLPRPYLARGELDIPAEGGRGSTVIAPRAIERAAELAALEHPMVVRAAGRYETEDLNLAVTVRQAGELARTLPAIRQRVRDAQQVHDLPLLPINVTLVGFDRSNRRELH